MITAVTPELQSKEFTEIHLQLKKSLTVLSQCIAVWKEAEIGANGHLKQVINLTDQYQCCANVQTQNLPLLKQFPDIRQRLLYKINTDINKEVAELKVFVYRLGEQSERIGKQYDHCIRHYDNYSTVGDIQNIVLPYTHLPPISEMLEWIERSERLLRDSFLCKKHLLATFSPLQADIDNLEKLWYKGDSQMLQQLSLYISSYADS